MLIARLIGHLTRRISKIFFGLATHYFKSNKIEDVKENFITRGEISHDNFEVKNDTYLIKNMNLINELFNGNIKTIISNLKNSNSEFSKKILDILFVKCPMSLAISNKLIDDAKGKSLKECLETEFQLSQKVVYRSDFDNGVNSVLISKDHNPLWEPSTIDEINIEDLDYYFETHTENLYL